MATTPLIPSERFSHQVQRSPFIDWAIILGTAVFIALILVGFGVSVYLGTGDALSAPAAPTAQSARLPLSIATLQGVLSDYDARAAERSALAKSYSAPKDPSLP